MDLHTDVVIVGAGGGGAILSLILSRKGIPNIVLEQAKAPPRGLRGEILQPNGQAILEELGLLKKLPSQSSHAVRLFHFRRSGGERLCTIDYGMLPPPYNRALVMWPHVVHHTILENLGSENPGGLRYGARFRSLLRNGASIVGVEADIGGTSVKIGAHVVVGADGPFSEVRQALGIRTALHRYRESYLIAMLESPVQLEEAQYYVGKKTILGLFPGAGRKIYAFYMVSSDALPEVKTQGIPALQQKWKRIAPDMASCFDSLVDWNQTAYLGTGRVRAGSWVQNGAVIMGDAAHGMNPHASQGRMQAMVDAVVLAEVLETCRQKRNWSAQALRPFETQRRPHVTMLQRLADEEVLFWNTGNYLLGKLRDRVFTTMDQNRRLQYQVLSATAGLRTSSPFGWIDRLQAAGLLPDPRANHVPVHPQPVGMS